MRLPENGVAFAHAGLASTETAIAFAHAGLASTETAIAFAGEKWVYFVRFSVEEVLSVSMVAVEGRAVVMAVSRWPASAAAVVSLVSKPPCHCALCAKKFALRHRVAVKVRKSSPCMPKTAEKRCFQARWASFFADVPVEGRGGVGRTFSRVSPRRRGAGRTLSRQPARRGLVGDATRFMSAVGGTTRRRRTACYRRVGPLCRAIPPPGQRARRPAPVILGTRMRTRTRTRGGGRAPGA